MSEVLASEVAPFGIRVAIIEPGVVETAIFDKAIEQPIDFESPYFPITFRTVAVPHGRARRPRRPPTTWPR